MGPPHWRLGDLIDFEFFLAEDRQLDGAVLQSRDHGIFLEVCNGPMGQGKASGGLARRVLFWGWLQARRGLASDPELLPGGVFAAAEGMLWKLLGVVGLITGAGLASGLLRYEGTQPVNVTVYFGMVVLVQMLWVMGTAAALLVRKAGRFSSQGGVGWAILRGVWTRLAVGLLPPVLAEVPGKRRGQAESFLGSFRMGQSLYGGVLAWRAISLWQWFGTAFNVGILAATLWLVTVSDRAFGWQSAVQFEPGQVHALVKWVAWPWSWALPEGVGAPTLEEVKGSQIVLKDGIRSLATRDLVSWWPFLALSVAVYGFCPRLFLLGLGWFWGRRALHRLDFSHVACDRLFERMTAGCLETGGGAERLAPLGLAEEEFEAGVDVASVEHRHLPAGSAVVLLEPELHRSVDLGLLGRVISARFQWGPGLFMPIHEDPLAGGAVWDRLGGLEWEDGQGRVVVLQEAWQPPIAENLGFLKRVRKVLGGQARMIVLLVGKPEGGNLLTLPRREDLRIWEQRLASLGDPRLRLEPWPGHEG